jgi:hypothetical protein
MIQYLQNCVIFKTLFCIYFLHSKFNYMGCCTAHGNKLLNMCINDNMYIANGRVGNEINIGKVTSKESSTVIISLLYLSYFPLLRNLILLILTRYFLMFIVAYKCQFHVQRVYIRKTLQYNC